jgi:hypothetical protein
MELRTWTGDNLCGWFKPEATRLKGQGHVGQKI